MYWNCFQVQMSIACIAGVQATTPAPTQRNGGMRVHITNMDTCSAHRIGKPGRCAPTDDVYLVWSLEEVQPLNPPCTTKTFLKPRPASALAIVLLAEPLRSSSMMRVPLPTRLSDAISSTVTCQVSKVPVRHIVTSPGFAPQLSGCYAGIGAV